MSEVSALSTSKRFLEYIFDNFIHAERIFGYDTRLKTFIDFYNNLNDNEKILIHDTGMLKNNWMNDCEHENRSTQIIDDIFLTPTISEDYGNGGYTYKHIFKYAGMNDRAIKLIKQDLDTLINYSFNRNLESNITQGYSSTNYNNIFDYMTTRSIIVENGYDNMFDYNPIKLLIDNTSITEDELFTEYIELPSLIKKFNTTIDEMKKNDSRYDILIQRCITIFSSFITVIDYTVKEYGIESGIEMSKNIMSEVFMSSVVITKFFIACSNNKRPNSLTPSLEKFHRHLTIISINNQNTHEALFRGMLEAWGDLKLSKIKRIKNVIIDRKQVLKGEHNILYRFDKYVSNASDDRIKRVFIEDFMKGEINISKPY